MADVTRDQFNESRRVVRKVLQKGRHLVDADWNEQNNVHVMSDRRILSALLQHTNYRFGDGFKLVGTGANLALTIKAGRAAFQIADEAAVMLELESDISLTGFSAFPGGGRTDHVYIDIYEDEVNASDDPNIVNPSLGQETCVDIRLAFALAISEGGAPASPPSGHTYITLGTVTSTDNTITASEVTNLLASFWDPAFFEFGGLNLLRNGSFELWYDFDPVYYYAARSWTDTYPGWAYGPSTTKETSIIRSGACSAKFTAGSTGLQGYVCQIVPNVARLRGKKIRASVWVTCAASAANKAIHLQINDGVGETSGEQVTLTTAGTWVELTIEHVVDASATTLAFAIMSGVSVVSWTCYVDDAGLFVGPAPRAFEPNPQDLIDAYDDALGASLGVVEVPLYCDVSQSHTDADAVALSDATIRHMATATSGGVTRTVIRLPYLHIAAYKALVLRCEAFVDNPGSGVGDAEIRLKNGAGTADVSFLDGTAARKTITLDMSSLAIGNATDITVELYAAGSSGSAYMQRVQISAKLAV